MKINLKYGCIISHNLDKQFNKSLIKLCGTGNSIISTNKMQRTMEKLKCSTAVMDIEKKINKSAKPSKIT